MTFTKQNPNVGARPGTLAIPPGAPEPEIHITCYHRDHVERARINNVADIAQHRREGWVTWVDIRGLGNEKVLRDVAALFDMHPLALESAVNVPQRAKTDLYEQHQLVVVRTPVYEANKIVVPQVCFVIGNDYLLTFQERFFGFFDSVRQRITEGIGPMRTLGPDYLAYALIDAMIDRYYPVAQRLSDRGEDIEDLVVDNPHPVVLSRIHDLRRQLVVLRRIGWPQREAISAMLREQSPFFSDKTKVFLRDTYDHIAQIVELIDSSREMASDLAEAYLSNVSHRTNEIMKVLTLMASIFIPLTFVAGIYGMNFEYIPELTVRGAYFGVWGVMVSVAVGMVLYFRHRGWLGNSPPPEEEHL